MLIWTKVGPTSMMEFLDVIRQFWAKIFFTLWSVTIFTLVKQHNQSVVRFYLAYIVQSTFLPVPICDQYYLQVKCSCAHIVIRNISLQTEKVLGFTNKIKVSISGLTVKLCKNVLQCFRLESKAQLRTTMQKRPHFFDAYI